MYLKKMSKKELRQYVKPIFKQNPELRQATVGNTWYFKMEMGGIKARNTLGQLMFTCMDELELKAALASGEFTGVEK